MNSEKRRLSPEELEAEYGLSQSWQGKARMKSYPSPIPFSKVGGKFIRYDRELIDKWLEANHVRGGKQ